MTIIDFHNHFYPPRYLEALQTESRIQVTFDSEQNPHLHYPGDYNVVVPGHRDIAYRQAVLEKAGIDKQVLTLTTPGTHVETPEHAALFAQMVNDDFAEIVAEHGDRFVALGTLPLNDPVASTRELERATNDLGLAGFMLFSNINGIELNDQRFWPLYERAAQLNTVFYIHPTNPAAGEAMKDYRLTPLLGFTFDTTVAAVKLVFSGIIERFPTIRWVLAHAGGTIPFLAERLDRGFEVFEECRENISKPPSTYLRSFYYDSVNFDPGSLQLTIDFAGADHLVAGSDYPHQIGSLEKMRESLEKLNVPAEDKDKIRNGNARKLLNL